MSTMLCQSHVVANNRNIHWGTLNCPFYVKLGSDISALRADTDIADARLFRARHACECGLSEKQMTPTYIGFLIKVNQYPNKQLVATKKSTASRTAQQRKRCSSSSFAAKSRALSVLLHR